ncbi:MAG: sensor histidine kinase [Croceivirga sp.]
MNITQPNRNRLFWLLQLLGWGFLNLSSIFLLDKLGTLFVIYSLLTAILIGIGSTTALRYYLRKIPLENFNTNKLLKIGLATFMAALIYGFLSFGFGYAYLKLVPEITEMEIKVMKALGNIWILAFQSIFIIGSWVVCYLVIKLIIKANQNRLERLELNNTLKQAQLNTLKGQINPHFMFNSLNNIRGLMLEDVERSREMLTKLSEMLRYSLTKNNIDGIAFEQELEMVDNYISLSKIQFEDRLKFEQQVEEATLKLQIPPMIVQLLVENAVKHGIANIREGGKIILNANKNNGILNIQVRNTGKLQIAGDSTQLGLNNIKQRLKLLYGRNASFVLNDLNDEVVAHVKIPME